MEPRTTPLPGRSTYPSFVSNAAGRSGNERNPLGSESDPLAAQSGDPSERRLDSDGHEGSQLLLWSDGESDSPESAGGGVSPPFDPSSADLGFGEWMESLPGGGL